MQNICVFAGATESVREEYHKVAREVGREVIKRGYNLVYGGGQSGLMGTVAKSAIEAGGDILQIVPDVWKSRSIEGSARIVTNDLRDRKEIMWSASIGYVALPGGFGTDDEVADVLAMNLFSNEIEKPMKPLSFVNVLGSFDDLLAHYERKYEENFALRDDRRMYFVTESPSKALDFIESYESPRLMKRAEHADAK